jgi:hypothetical protein
MRLGPYAAEPEGLKTLVIAAGGALRMKLFGLPRVPGATPVEIAQNVLRANAQGVLRAGSEHFWPMWPSDFGKAFKGAEHALEPGYLREQIERMILESARLGRVTSCFSTSRGFDMPWWRGDNLPWLIIALAEYGRWTGDGKLAEARRNELQTLISSYEAESMEDGLISRRVTGDWMDTILRPSSTYNNVCALRMFQLAPSLGLKAKTDPVAMEKKLLDDRWRDGCLADYSGADRWSVDAGVLALYLELFTPEHRDSIIAKIEASGVAEPFPIRSSPEPYPDALISPLAKLASDYHSTIWLHLGAMYLNGLKKAGRDVSARKAKLDELTLRHGNCLETLGLDGKPWWTPFFACEPGLSMAAGQYLELALG